MVRPYCSSWQATQLTPPGRASCCALRHVLALCATLAALIVATPAQLNAAEVRDFVLDFESVGLVLAERDFVNTTALECLPAFESLPARGTRALRLELTSTKPDAAYTTIFNYRSKPLFDDATELAFQVWCEDRDLLVAALLIDAEGRVIATPSATPKPRQRWQRYAYPLEAEKLRRVDPESGLITDTPPENLTQPLSLYGVRLRASRAGQQSLIVDDFELRRSVEPYETVRARLNFGAATHWYAPGDVAACELTLQNLSQTLDHRLQVNIEYLTAEGRLVHKLQERVHLLPSGSDSVATQTLNVSRVIEQPGLNQIRATLAQPGWRTQPVVSGAFAVQRSNRGLPRSRKLFFGVRANLLSAPPADRTTEIALARDLGMRVTLVPIDATELRGADGDWSVAPLRALVDELIEQELGVALQISLADVPVAERPAAARALLADVIRTFGPRMTAVQVTELPARDFAALVKQRADAELGPLLLTPLIDIDQPPPTLSTDSLSNEHVRVCFAAAGAPGTAIARVAAYASRHDLPFDARALVLFSAAPLAGQGTFADALAVFRLYADAAQRDLGGVIFANLRDTNSDPRDTAGQQGLVDRRFSPRLRALGIARAARQLNSVRYDSVVLGAAPDFESALFIGAGRQLALLTPRDPNALPALFQLGQGVEGALVVTDFAGRVLPPLGAPERLIFATIPELVFVELTPETAQPAPQIAVADPWLKLPRRVYYGPDARFEVEALLPPDAQRGAVRFEKPRLAPYNAAPRRVTLSDTPARTTVQLVPVERLRGDSTLDVAVDLDTDEFSFSVLVAPRAQLNHDPELFAVAQQVGALIAGGRAKQGGLPDGAVFAALDGARLRIGVQLAEAPFAEDELLVALADDDKVLRWRITGLGPDGKLKVAGVDRDDAPAGLKVQRGPTPDGIRQCLELEVPLSLLDVASNSELRAAVRYRWGVPGGVLPPTDYYWGDPQGDPPADYRLLALPGQ